MERIAVRDEEMDHMGRNEETEERDMNQTLRVKKMKSIADVLEEVAVAINMHFFVEFSRTKSSTFLKEGIANQGAIETKLFKSGSR